jgi:hypothetical protein
MTSVAVETVDQRVTAAVLVVELALGDRVVDVDRREEQRALTEAVVQPQHAGGRLLGDALDVLGDVGPVLGLGLDGAGQDAQHLLELLVVGAVLRRHDAGLLELDAQVQQHRDVAAVVQEHVGAALGEVEDLLGLVPVLGERFALPREDGGALGVLDGAVAAHDDGSGGVVLGREDVARGPADIGTERRERLDEDGRLDRHVQRSGDAGSGERLARSEALTHGHEARHLVLGEVDLLATVLREGEVCDVVIHAQSLPVGAHVHPIKPCESCDRHGP